MCLQVWSNAQYMVQRGWCSSGRCRQQCRVGAALDSALAVIGQAEVDVTSGVLWNRHHYLNSSEKKGLKLKQWMT